MQAQTFQSQAQLFALKAHAVYMKVENAITFPFRWVAEQCGQTDTFRQSQPVLRRVK